MKKALITAIIAAFLGLGMSACVVHSHRPHPHHRHPPKSHPHKPHPHKHKKHKKHKKPPKSCAPSHYWDGHKCRHKGKGHGARKHDY